MSNPLALPDFIIQVDDEVVNKSSFWSGYELSLPGLYDRFVLTRSLLTGIERRTLLGLLLKVMHPW
jgi:hypothetical protein